MQYTLIIIIIYFGFEFGLELLPGPIGSIRLSSGPTATKHPCQVQIRTNRDRSKRDQFTLLYITSKKV